MIWSELYLVRRTSQLLLAMGLLLGCVSTIAAAQTTGSVTGQVFDPDGRLVPGATVALANGTGTLQARSKADGTFSLKAVVPGSYTLTVEAVGFSALRRKV